MHTVRHQLLVRPTIGGPASHLGPHQLDLLVLAPPFRCAGALGVVVHRCQIWSNLVVTALIATCIVLCLSNRKIEEAATATIIRFFHFRTKPASIA